MGKKRLVDVEDGIKTYHTYDEKERKTIIQTEQDVQPLFDNNTKLRNNASRGWKGDFHHVASIPFVIYQEMLRKVGYDFKKGGSLTEDQQKQILVMLSTREYTKLRTKEGRLA